MPQFGEKISGFSKGNSFVQLKNVGEKITFRIVRNPDGYIHEAKHFMQDGDRWIVESCPRMIEVDCAYCEQYFDIIKPRKQLKADQKASNDDKEKAEIQVKLDAIDKEARPYKVSEQFYIPIIDRGDGAAKIIQTSHAVTGVLDEMINNGMDVYKYDYLLVRKAKNGAGTWSFERIDSADSKELTESEQQQYDKANTWNLYDLTGVGKALKDLRLSYKEEVEKPREKKAAEKAAEAKKVDDPIMTATEGQGDVGNADHMVAEFNKLG